ncbi:MAG TPA: hypothetical protein VFT31_01710 [Kribbella sp.]|nr:hypothetical protein [Kribbella sp.]
MEVPLLRVRGVSQSLGAVAAARSISYGRQAHARDGEIGPPSGFTAASVDEWSC